MSSYAKFLKEVLSNKRKLEEYETVTLTEECSAIIQNKLPPKLKDPGSFSIPCVIGNVSINRAMYDLGASVSLMPMSICKKLDTGDLKPTTISLQLEERSVKYEVCILEDVPIQVGKFFILVDFVILEIEEDSNILIILGRPFLATTGATINVKNERFSLNIGGEMVEFDLSNAMKLPLTDKVCYMVDVINKCTHEQLANHYSVDPLKKCLLESLMLEPKSSTREEDKVRKVELQPLPSSLRYEFLGPNSTYPVIVNACLNENETDKLLRTLRMHHKVIGYTMDDIKGINQSICMHSIFLEDDDKPSIEHQHRLNPGMKKVVKKEVLKLLDAGVKGSIDNRSYYVIAGLESLI
ncbi:uncharacterized protein LOC109841631 [Asparagus officinalis]|uniref:uncharacterized protein LOC109841631 n=1 Tax=Asparagus officinalis TaxID=4686 RepID=UPI00098E540D|nr:uncharacterized protein LOC109841631 [Asparagus officinalis]